MRFENAEVFNFEGAIRGMRNPKNSWDKSDSIFGLVYLECCEDNCEVAELWAQNKFNSNDIKNGEYDEGAINNYVDEKSEWLIRNGILRRNGDVADVAFIGPKDMGLMQNLIKAGSEHRKFMRQIFVSVDITAPLYWWKEFDTYKVGTVANSCSTMHKITAKKFDISDFSVDHLETIARFNEDNEPYQPYMTMKSVIDCLNACRETYLKTKNKTDWWQIIQLLPSSYNQKRTITMTYENLFSMCSKGQRRFHKLNEWSGRDNPELENFISFARKLPYAQELIFIDETLPETITISKETYDMLVDSNRKLTALECGGVDNWEGYAYSLSEFYKDRLEDDE